MFLAFSTHYRPLTFYLECSGASGPVTAGFHSLVGEAPAPPEFTAADRGTYVVPLSTFQQEHHTQSPVHSIPLETPLATVPSPVPPCCSLCFPSTMPLRFVDPEPFIPQGFNRVMIEGRRPVSRAIVGRQPRRNSDLAIALITPMPNHQISFNDIREVLDDFLRDHMHVHFRSIQPCPFGQAFIRFNAYYDRGRLIHDSPHAFGDVSISFIPHDRAWNHKKVTLNYEVWLMFLGLNVDHWNNHLIDKALADWGHLITWEEDLGHLARVLVKARVVDL